MRLFLFLMCVSMGAWGAEYWVDLSGTGTGAADGSDVDNLCAGVGDSDCTPSAGDTVYLCNERAAAQTLATAGENGNPITYDWTCPGGTAGSIQFSGGTALTLNATHRYVVHYAIYIRIPSVNNGVFLNGADDVTFIWPDIQAGQFAFTFSTSAASNNIKWDGGFLRNGQRGFNLLPNSGSLAYGPFMIDGITVTGMSDFAIRMTVESGGASSTTINDVTVMRSTIADNAGGGIRFKCGDGTLEADTAIWCADVVIENNVIRDNAINASGTAGGVTVSGYSSGRVVNNTIDNVGVLGGMIGGSWSRNLLVAWNNINGAISLNEIDGDGIFIDRYSQAWTVKGNYISGCDTLESYGAAIAIFIASHNIISGNISKNCQQAVRWGGSETSNNSVVHNTFVAEEGVVAFFEGSTKPSSPAAAITFRNNAVQGFAAGILTTADLDTYGYNNYDDVATLHDGQSTGVGTDIQAASRFIGGTSPTTAAGFKPAPGSPLCAAGTSLGSVQDYGNRRFKTPPAIGAWECARGSPRESVSVRTSVQARQ